MVLQMGTLQHCLVRPLATDLTTVAPYMFWLIFCNVASDGFVSRTWQTPASCRNPGAC